ncbi:MAG: glutathione S-transferase family protein [Dongiaceae bacterium]
MLKVLGRKTSGNVQKVIWLLEEIKQPYEREDYGRQFGNTGGDYLRLNPNGKVPTLVDGDVVVWESNTILRYLGNKHGGSFYPADPAARSHVERWMDWQLAALNNPYLAIFRDAKKPAAERSASFAGDAKELDQQLQILDAGIGGSGWIAGSGMSLADICLGPIIARCLDFPIELSALPKLRAWRGQIGQRAAFKAATS